jgi:hypothetical protein
MFKAAVPGRNILAEERTTGVQSLCLKLPDSDLERWGNVPAKPMRNHPEALARFEAQDRDLVVVGSSVLKGGQSVINVKGTNGIARGRGHPIPWSHL